MARIVLFPEDDPEQGVRYRRFLIGAATSCMILLLLGLCFAERILAPAPFAVASGAIIGLIGLFYLLFRLGLNKKARDPSLTIPMMVSAICVVTYVLYHIGPARATFLLLYPVIMFFGVFWLTARALLGITIFILVAYATVIGTFDGAGAEGDGPRIQVLEWIVLTAVLVWFSLMGGYISDLRRRLRQSHYDPLTGVYNRRRIVEIVTHEKIRCDRGAGPLSVCVIDIDLFKQINDNYGHAAGDRALQTFVGAVHAELRNIDFIGRYGGEEFLLVLTQTPLEGALDCAERVRRQTEKIQCQCGAGVYGITASIGVTEYRPGESVDDLVARADAALYRSKTAGRNRVTAA